MTVLVNYYTCSYGNSLVSMFNGNPVVRKDGIVDLVNVIQNGVAEHLTKPNFYQQDIHNQREICQSIEQGVVQAIPCHRQNGFDFTKVFENPLKVITVLVDDFDCLLNRYNHIHIELRGNTMLNPMLEKMRQRLDSKQLRLLIQKDYEIWLKANYLKTDIEFRLSWLDTPNKVKDFCQEHNLNYDPQWVDNIVNDMSLYRTTDALLQR